MRHSYPRLLPWALECEQHGEFYAKTALLNVRRVWHTAENLRCFLASPLPNTNTGCVAKTEEGGKVGVLFPCPLTLHDQIQPIQVATLSSSDHPALRPVVL